MVALNTHVKHNHVPSPISPHFKPPAAAKSLTFGPLALAAAVARTATTGPGSPFLLAGLQKSALAQLECLVSNSSVFDLTADFSHLADFEKTSIAARCGAGVTDLYMNALGYTWRANAACLGSGLTPHADFIYEGGNVAGHGVVLAEAHGTFAGNTTYKSVKAKAESKYRNQVKPYLNMSSPYGKIVHGYSLAFGAKPGAPGSFLSLSETRVSKTHVVKGAQTETDVAGGMTPTAIALTTHRSNFLLMESWQVVDWIDWAIGQSDEPRDYEPVTFIRFPFAGRWYLGSQQSIWQAVKWFDFDWGGPNEIQHVVWRMLARRIWGEIFGWFAMEETACIRFLNSLTGILRAGRTDRVERLELPSLDPVGFSFGDGRESPAPEHREYQHALFRDGLALISAHRSFPKFELRRWLPKTGFELPT
jgi:hypothetical protein